MESKLFIMWTTPLVICVISFIFVAGFKPGLRTVAYGSQKLV